MIEEDCQGVEVDSDSDTNTQELDEDITEAISQLLDEGDTGWSTETIVYHGSKHRSILLSGPIDETTANGICSQLHQLATESDDPIVMHINTPGGSVIDALAIYDVMKTIEAPVVAMVNGACFSAGLIIISGADLRLSMPNSAFFYHQPIMDSQEILSSEIVQTVVSSYQWSQKRLDTIIRERAGISKKQWKRDFEGRLSKHFGTKKALKYGIIDEILEYSVKPKLELARETDG